MNYLTANFAMSETSYPYTAMDGACVYNASNVTSVQNSGYVQVAPANEIAALMTAVATGPTSVTIQANRMVFQMYQSGVLNDTKCGTRLDHAVAAVGYGTDVVGGDYWLVRSVQSYLRY